ncbi:MAG: amidohydrolase family protein [Nitrososphaerota archaeon]
MRIIDSHGHYMALPYFRKTIEEELIVIMDGLKIDMLVLTPFEGLYKNSKEDHDRIYNAYKKFPNRFIPFATANPYNGMEALKEIERTFKMMNFKGLKLHPIVQAFSPINPIVYPFIEKAIEYNVPILFHTGDPVYGMPFQLCELAREYQKATFIMGHMGLGEYWYDAIRSAKKTDNIYLDTTGCRYKIAIEKAIKEIGADRILYGSDMPFLSTELELKKVLSLNISNKELELILYENAAKIFKIKI